MAFHREQRGTNECGEDVTLEAARLRWRERRAPGFTVSAVDARVDQAIADGTLFLERQDSSSFTQANSTVATCFIHADGGKNDPYAGRLQPGLQGFAVVLNIRVTVYD